MVDHTLPSFDDAIIQQTLDAARQYGQKRHAEMMAGPLKLEDGALKLAAQCVSVTVTNGQICLNLPIVGSQCLPIPSWIPNGTAAQACLHICTHWGIPCGIEVTVSVANREILKKGFGCSC